jgi:hypothetical protein
MMKSAKFISFGLMLTGTLFLAGQILRADVLEKTFDAANGLKVSVKTIAPYAQPADLQIVCVFRHKTSGDTYIQAMKDLDDKLGGLLSSLRNRGEFIGELGETILLDLPASKIAAKQLLVIGLGDESALTLDTLRVVGRVAATEATHLKARIVSFAPTMRDQGNATIGVGEGDEAVIENVLLTYDTNQRLQKEHLAAPFAIDLWTIDAGTKFYEEVTQKVGQGVETASQAIAKREAANVHQEDSTLPGTNRENLADAAQHLFSDMRETHYQHKTHVERAEGVYDMDCSGFVDYLLKRIAPGQFGQLHVEPGHARPRATMYFQLLHDLLKQPLRGWTAVRQLAHAQRGDVIAWELQASTQGPGDTGHVVIVAAAPIQVTEMIYRVEVYDSSGIRHDDDSRPEQTSGIGRGTITFRVNEKGEPIAFQFNSRAHFHEEPIAIGRLVSQEDAFMRAQAAWEAACRGESLRG